MNLTRYFSIIFCLFLAKSIGQVTVETSNLNVNGVAVTNNTINFNNNSSLNLSLNVNLTTLDGSNNNLLGNLFIYYKASSSENEVQIGFSSVTFVSNYPPFVTQTNYTSINVLTNIIINANLFYNTNGVIFAKYVNNNNSSYNSSNINVIGGTRVVAPIYTGSNSICCSQTIRYGDRPSVIVGSTLPVNSFVEWAQINNTQFPNATYYGRNYADDKKNQLDPDYMFETKTFKRKLPPGGSNSLSNEVTITVIPTPIITNIISTNAILTIDGSYEISQSSPIEFYGDNSFVSLNILADPNHVYTRTDNVVNATSYQWQYNNTGDISQKWIDILGANQANLTNFVPSGSNLSKYLVRRIAKYNSISRVSNELTILLRKATTTNTVCCSQLLNVTTTGYSTPSIIVGSLPSYNAADSFYMVPTITPANLTILYQWQSQSRSSAWVNISGANSKDYLPPSITTPSVTNNYRRVVRFNFTSNGSNFYYETYSTIVSVSTPNRVRAKIEQVESIIGNNEISIYPNPTSTNLNVNNVDSFDEIKIINAIGQLIKLNVIKLNDNSISIDVSSLQSGIYYLSLENGSEKVIKRFVKE